MNVIPSAWYRTIRKETGKPYLNAIVILSDIVYWYRAAEVRDKEDGEIIGYRKRFKADILQRSYQQIAEQFGISKRDASNAIIALEKLGVVKRVFRKLRVDRFIIPNVMFLTLDVEALRRLTFPDGEEPGDDDRGRKDKAGTNPEIMEETTGEEIWDGRELDKKDETEIEGAHRAETGEDRIEVETKRERGKGDSDNLVTGKNNGNGAGDNSKAVELPSAGKNGRVKSEGTGYAKMSDIEKNGVDKEPKASRRHENRREDSLGYQITCSGEYGALAYQNGGLPIQGDTTETSRERQRNQPVDTADLGETNTEITYKDYNRESLILSSYQGIKEEFKRQIEYDILKHDLGDTGELDELVEIASEVLTSKAGTIRVNREERQTAEVKERYRSLTMLHVQYVLHCLTETAAKIRNVRAVMITALYNASSTMSTYYGNLYRNHAFGAA